MRTGREELQIPNESVQVAAHVSLAFGATIRENKPQQWDSGLSQSATSQKSAMTLKPNLHTKDSWTWAFSKPGSLV